MMSQLVVDLNKLLKKGQPWVLGSAQQAAHNGVKAVFNLEAVVLCRMNYDKQLILHIDFSNRRLGAVLGQLDEQGNKYMCACIGQYERKMRSCCKNIIST